jgi:hypothetical protein
VIATVWEVAGEHLVSFGAGVICGFVGSSRYRLVRRNGGDNDGQLQ